MGYELLMTPMPRSVLSYLVFAISPTLVLAEEPDVGADEELVFEEQSEPAQDSTRVVYAPLQSTPQ